MSSPTDPAEPTGRPTDGPVDNAAATQPQQAVPGAQTEPTAQWRAEHPAPPAEHPAAPAVPTPVAPPAPGRLSTAFAKPRTRIGLALVGALVVGGAAGSLITSAASDGDGHHGGPRDGNARFDRDGRDGAGMQRGRFPGPDRDGRNGDRRDNNGNNGNNNGNGNAPSTVPSGTPTPAPSSTTN